MMWIGVGSMGGGLFTDKLVFRWLEVLGIWSLDSATPVILVYPAHAIGAPWGNSGTGSKKKGGKSYKEVVKKG